MMSAVRHNSACGGRSPAINGRDRAAAKGKTKRDTISFKESSRSTSAGSSDRSDRKHEYTLVGDTEQKCNMMD